MSKTWKQYDANGNLIGSSGVSTFIALTDTPSDFTGDALKVARVNAGETAIEFAAISGTGDVVGPVSATSGAVVLYDGVSGKLIKDSTILPTTVGIALNNLANPSAIRFIRINADNSVTARTAAEFLSDIGAQVAGSYLTSANIVATINNGVTTNAPSEDAVFDALAGKANALGADDNYVTDAEKVVIGNTSGTNSGNETASTLGATINGAGAATPNDTDLVTTVDTSVVKKITWTNVKAFIKTYFDTLYNPKATGTPDGTKYLRDDNTWQAIAASGDMVLASVQTVSGAKTFNDTKLLMRNVANTFNGSFTNTNSADRVYTLPDATDTVVLLGVAQTLTSKTLTTPVITNTVANTVGSVERNANVFVGTPVSGASGIIPTTMFAIVESGGFALATASGVQSAFPATKDVWTLAASTTYYVEGMYYISKATTALTTAIAFALGGGASITSMRLEVISTHAAANTTATANNSTIVDRVASTVVTASSAANAMISFKGLIRMNAGGTVTPQINWSTTATATPNMNANSYIRFTPLGTDTTNSIGNVA